MLKYVKSIVHLVENLGERYLTYHPPSQKFGGIHLYLSGIYALACDVFVSLKCVQLCHVILFATLIAIIKI